MTIKITLTFDNGPTPGVTEHVLDLLHRYGIRSTFFVLGENIADPQRLALAKRAVDEGHWVGNHTYSHAIPFGDNSDPQASEQEIGRTQKLIGGLAHPQRWFRPFGGGGYLGPHLLSEAALDYLRDGAFSCVLWNAVPRDWENPDGWVATALEQITEQPWTLMVLHDLDTGAMTHLEQFILAALAAGATFVQAFPDTCLPIVGGKVQSDISAYVRAVA